MLLLLLASPAAARPRDEVMINVYRCAGHASTRIWLDCYYGAAQPQRAALGLTPAPPAQVALVTAPPAPGAQQDLAVRDAAVLGAAGCGSVVAERPWLDCYYAAANPVRGLLGLAPVAGPASAPPAPPPPRKAASVATDLSGKPGTGSGRMTSYTFDRNGFFTVTLDNGEVWRQLTGDSSVARWFRKPQTYAVTVTDGLFGSHNLRVKGEPGMFKVRRVF
ncbi:MAG: hypothetical protein BGN82_05150 [Alphaproteobacteria bacterium 65-7]|nr:MAG: hypothetical protein BGN82_05150 [Alphaproteobacteria bacterium 65-7]